MLKLFQARELMSLVVGNENYDWKELESTTEYKVGFYYSITGYYYFCYFYYIAVHYLFACKLEFKRPIRPHVALLCVFDFRTDRQHVLK